MKILGVPLKAVFLVDSDIVAYSLHFSFEKAVNHLKKIAEFHGLKGKMERNQELEREFEKIIEEYLKGKKTF